ncbi:MAG: Hint domain-containing protein [Rhodobacteraceae bacterium]|nr:Hint domain-containing protein [Paracoccaceae bacterium]
MKPKSVGRVDGFDPLSHPVSSPRPKIGFVAGTFLYTREGEVPVEFLSPGDNLITRDAGMVRLTRIHHRRCVSRAILFAAGSLGHTRPEQDLILPGAQLVLIRDWRAQSMFGVDQALVRADALVDDEFIRDLGVQKLHLHQLEFGAPHIIYVGGVELSCMTSGTQTHNLAA